MSRTIPAIKAALRAERKTALALRGRIITHGGRKRAPKLWRSYQRHKTRIADLKVELRRARLRAHPPLRVRAYHHAKQFVGVMERGGNNRGPEVEAIIREGGGIPGQAWCGWFVALCYKRAGSKAVSWHWGAVRLLFPLPKVYRTRQPRQGDLVRFTFDHVGMFERDNGDGTISTIEGNTGATGAVSDSATGGDGVYRKRRSKTLVRDYLRIRA